jgi:hypothetical protein
LRSSDLHQKANKVLAARREKRTKRAELFNKLNLKQSLYSLLLQNLKPNPKLIHLLKLKVRNRKRLLRRPKRPNLRLRSQLCLLNPLPNHNNKL